MRLRVAGLVILLSLGSSPIFAYVGPGLGIGTIGAVLGVVGSIFLALFAAIYYPFKRLLKNRKAKVRNDIIISKGLVEKRKDQ